MRLIVFISILFFVHIPGSYGQIGENLNVNYMFRGYFYANSPQMDGLGGYATSKNYPLEIINDMQFEETGLFLKIEPSNSKLFADKYKGQSVYLVNKSDSMVTLNASDSRLNIIAEARINGKWKAIEYLPSSWCGNSYHTVELKSQAYWEFNVPVYHGKLKAKLRYRLELDNKKYIYSNYIDVGINKNQLKIKQGHKPSSIMDPYYD